MKTCLTCCQSHQRHSLFCSPECYVEFADSGYTTEELGGPPARSTNVEAEIDLNICLHCGGSTKKNAQYCSATCLDLARLASTEHVAQKQRASTTLDYHERRHAQATYW